MIDLQAVAVGFALAEVDHQVREVGGNNMGPRVRQYLGNCDPPIGSAAPWCAAWVQYITDRAAKGVSQTNPLDGVALEALVQSYWNWGHDNGRLVTIPKLGDLVCFNFHGKRWDHIGIYLAAGPSTQFKTIEGNTGDDGGRDGDGVYLKIRDTSRYPTALIRWGA